MRLPNGFRIDDPSFASVMAQIAYWGRTSGNGNALGTTLVCADLDNHPTYVGDRVKVFTGGAWGQGRMIKAHAVGGILAIEPYTDSAGAVQQIVAGTDFAIITNPSFSISDILSFISTPTINLYEGWQDETGIDLTVWTLTNPATGAAWARGAVGELLMAYSSPNANENARIRSNQRWIVSPGLYGVNKILRRFALEFEAHFIGSVNFNNVNFLLGLTPAIGDTRATNNIIAFSLVGAGNALQTLTDAGGAETVNTGFGENLLLTNKFKIDISLNSVKFYLNEALIANHITNLPSNAPLYLNFYAPTGAGGASTIRLGTVRAWTEDI